MLGKLNEVGKAWIVNYDNYALLQCLVPWESKDLFAVEEVFFHFIL